MLNVLIIKHAGVDKETINSEESKDNDLQIHRFENMPIFVYIIRKPQTFFFRSVIAILYI